MMKLIVKGAVYRKKAGSGIRWVDEESECAMSIYDFIKEQAEVLGNILWT